MLAGGPEAEVSLDDLRAELGQYVDGGLVAEPTTARSCRKPNGAKRPGTKVVPPRAKRPARGPIVLPAAPLLHRDHPLVLEIRGFTMDCRRKAGGKRAMDAVLGAGRAAAELVRVALARIGWGREHDEFRAWAEAGGVPEGERDTWLYSVAACLAHALLSERILDGTLRGLVVRVGEASCGREWTASGWVGERCDGAVVAKAVQAALGESIVRDGKRWDPRYRWNAAALRRDLGIGDNEARALGLLTLAEGAVEKQSRRALVALRKPEPPPDPRAEARAEVLRLRAEGLSLRVVSRRTGVPVGTVQAWGARAAGASAPAGSEGRSVTPSTRLGGRIGGSEGESFASVKAVPNMPVVLVAAGAVEIVQALAAVSTGPRMPSFLVRRLEERRVAAERAEAYVAQVDVLASELCRRGAVAPRAWPVPPPTEAVDDVLRGRVEAAARSLRAVLASVHRRQDVRTRRRETNAERDGFWSECQAMLMQDPLEAEEMALGRLAAIQARWDKRAAAADGRAEASGREADRAGAARIRMAARAVIHAERRKHGTLFGYQLAA